MINYIAPFPRLIEPRIREALLDTPVVLILGPRQAGKTTLVRQMAGATMRYVTLDDAASLLSAQRDPEGFVQGLDRAVIDEIQRAPELLLAIKKSVDQDRRPGRFLLTGSANLMALPAVADSLAGRMETLCLLPLSQSEMNGAKANWLDSIFAGKVPQSKPVAVVHAMVERVLRGGYPEVVARPTARRRTAWGLQYTGAILARDVRDMFNVEKLDLLPRFLSALAQTSGQVCNLTQLGGQLGLDQKTVSKYIGIFEQMYLLKKVNSWANNRLSRVLKAPKLQFIDSGLLAILADVTPAAIEQDRCRFSSILESFVFSELLKHRTTAEGQYQIFYYRDRDQYEVDFVIENAAGDILGVEVKSHSSVKARDLRGLQRLATLAGEKFKGGYLLYDGEQILPLGERQWAIPISSLWGAVV
jgi:predicted AAA+ superfamily ATPase